MSIPLTWYGPPPGTHLITARVVDSLGGVTVSAPTTLIVLPDSDGDGMDDDWELQNGLDPALDDARLDLDGDGAFNRFEYVRGTSPTDPEDTPANAPASISITSPQTGAIFIQGQTVSISASATDPDTGVSKVEFLKDGQKIGEDTYPSWSYGWNTAQSSGPISLTAVAVDEYGHQTASAPVSLTIRADTDLDGMPDDWETASGLNPANPADASRDLDNDGYTNLEEFQIGKNPNTAEDTDGDGLPDGKERKFIYRTPSGGWGYFNINSADTDANGTPDGQEDYDKDGLTVLQEVALGTNPNLSDTDGDGVSDGKEVSHGTNPLVADAWANRDSDNDGLDDLTEITIGTNPFNPDTNGNGMPDGEELDRGGDPANPGPPPPPLPPPSPDPEPPGDPSPEPPPAITPGEYDILVETKSVSFPKHGHATFQVLDPPKRYLTMTASQTYAGSDGEVESGPLGISGSVTWTIDALTGNTTTSGDNFVSSFGDPASPVRKSGTRQQYGYDDPPNQKGDGTATINGVTLLASENTTEMMVTNGKGKLEAFADDLQPGTPFAYRNVHENELAFDYQKVQFKFKWKDGVTEDQRYALTYLLLFQPEDDPDTQEDESTENAEVIETITWNGQAGGSQTFTVDPDQRKSGIDGSYSLLPVEIRDIKDHANTADDVTITNWTTGQEITDANIAWIEAHSSATDDAPRMPQLEFNVPGLPQNVTLEAKLLVEYERPYAGKQADDTVRVPANGSFQSVTNGRWQIWNDYTNIPFFGGDATLTYKINGGGEQTIKFAIGGRNPDDARCKTYTQGRPNAPWYAYAIEKHESQAYNPGFYNQFWERSGNSSPINNGVNYQFTRGDALVVRSPGETGVGGTGLAQVTGAGGNKTVSAPREIFWNWQRNVDALMVILAGKIQLAETFMNDPAPRNGPGSMPNGQRPQTTFHTGNNVPVPSRVQGRVTFGDAQGNKRPEDAVAIKAYNGASAHWCSWRGPTVHEWQFNYGQNNYVEQVGNQVEEAQP